MWILAGSHGAKYVRADSTSRHRAYVVLNYSGGQYVGSLLHRIPNQPEGVQYNSSRVSLPVSTIFVLLVLQPFGRFDSWPGEACLKESWT